MVDWEPDSSWAEHIELDKVDDRYKQAEPEKAEH